MSTQQRIRPGQIAGLLLFLVPFLGSCTTRLLNPVAPTDHVQVTYANLTETMAQNRSRPVTAQAGKRDLTLADCRAIALQNNLDYHVAAVDELTKIALKQSNRLKVLPHISVSGELSERDNQRYSYSDVFGQEGVTPVPGAAGTGVTNYSMSHERGTKRFVLEGRWSPTDAALAYYVTKSSSNDRLKAHHHKVRIGQKLIGVVDAAYYRLLALNKCLPMIKRLVALRADAAASLKRLRNDTLVRIEDYHRSQEKASEARRMLARTLNGIQRERNLLASAMALSPDACLDGGFQVQGDLEPPRLTGKLCDLEWTAVKNRPEAFQAGLAYLTSMNDLRRTIVKYFPRVTGFWRQTVEKDKYLYHTDWKEVGFYVSFDLLDWLTNRKESAAAQFNTNKTQREMGAVALGISTEVRVEALKYFDALDDLRTRQEFLNGSKEVLKVARARVAGDDLSQLEYEETKGDVLQREIEQIRSIGEANAALAELQSAMGTNYTEPLPCE